MRVLKENKVTDAVIDYVYGLTKEDLISFEEADNFVNLLVQGGVDDADEYMVFDCANGSPLGNEDCAIRAIKSYFKESKKPSKKRIKESFDNPIDEIIMPYTSWSSTPLRSDADAMAENAKEAAEELKANGFTVEEVKAHFDEDGYYDAVNGTTEGEGTWDRAFANCVLANLKESKKNSKKRIKEGAVKELYTELEEELEKAYKDDPMDHYTGIDTTDARIDLTIEAFAKDHNLSIETVEAMAKEIQDRWVEEQFENWEEWQADPEGYINTHPEEFGADPLAESVKNVKGLRESEINDIMNKPFTELIDDFLEVLVEKHLLNSRTKQYVIEDLRKGAEPEDLDIDLLYDGVGADPNNPVNDEMFKEIADMLEDAYEYADYWAGIDESDMVDDEDYIEEDDPLYGYGEDEVRDMGEMYGVPRGATSEEALRHFESKKAPNKKSLKEDRSLGRTPKSFNEVGRGTTVVEKDGEPWTVIEKGTVGELNRKYPEHQIYEPSYYHAVYVGDPICDYHHENKGERIFVYGEYDNVYNNVLAYYDDGPSRSWSVYMKESKKAPNRKTLKEDAIAKDSVGIEIKSSKGWVWASKDGLKPGAPLEYKNEKAAKSSKEWKTFLDKYGEENLRVSKANK